MVRLRFPLLLFVALSTTAMLPIVVGEAVSRYPVGPPWCLEVVAWCCITSTYVLFVPAELLGPRAGLHRLVERSWSPIALYLSVYMGLSGAVLGLSGLWALGVGGAFTLPMIAIGLVTYHFAIRHTLTEEKGTPHLGQRGAPQRKRVERVFGQVGDAFLLMALWYVYTLTRHPIWLFGLLLLGVGYMLGVWIHGWLDPNPEASSSYLAVLACLVIMVAAILRFGALPEISRLDALYGNAFLAALVGVSAIFIQARTLAALVAGGGLALGTLYGLLVSQPTIPTSFRGMLLRGNAPVNAVGDYALFLFVACCALNVFLANLNAVYHGLRKKEPMPSLWTPP